MANCFRPECARVFLPLDWAAFDPPLHRRAEHNWTWWPLINPVGSDPTMTKCNTFCFLTFFFLFWSYADDKRQKGRKKRVESSRSKFEWPSMSICSRHRFSRYIFPPPTVYTRSSTGAVSKISFRIHIPVKGHFGSADKWTVSCCSVCSHSLVIVSSTLLCSHHSAHTHVPWLFSPSSLELESISKPPSYILTPWSLVSE